MRVLVLSLALFLFCTPALAQFDGSRCFDKTVETTMPGCGKFKHDYGICADSSGDGDRAADAFEALGGLFRGEEAFTVAECEEQYASMCGGADKVTTSGCDQWCRLMQAVSTSGTLGCVDDKDCPTTGNEDSSGTKKPCCAFYKDIMQNTCSYTDDAELDAAVTAKKDDGECTDVDCASAGAHAGASFTTTLIMGALALVTIWRF